MKTVKEYKKELLGKTLNGFVVTDVYLKPEGINQKTYIDTDKSIITPIAETFGNTKIFVELKHSKTEDVRVDAVEDIYQRLITGGSSS